MDKDRYNDLLKNLAPTLKMQLDNIKDYLYFDRGDQKYGNASLMIGAGFSKNADKTVDVAMLDWNELGKKFYAKLYGREPAEKELIFRSPIKLATMVEAEFGRTVLDKMIQDSLPDDRVYPNDLYSSLLNLPWHDIFTTNYDRLLERSFSLADAKRRYHVVTNKETLIYTPSPRIVKLHGSFPDIHPYIITEEDYRTYPERYPEFVNTVRQAMIENLFCLIGFSGDDPNFLSWIGWLRDVMGRLSMPVYMITFDKDIHGAQLKLLESKKIDVVNLADIDNMKNYREAFEFLFEYLRDSNRTKGMAWKCELDFKLDSPKEIHETLAKACRIRESYPGWLVLPESYYQRFDRMAGSYKVAKCLKTLKDENVRLILLFEFDWRLNVSLTPRRFDWFKSELEDIKIANKDEWDIKQKKLWLQISLLSIYRHIGEDDKYAALSDSIKQNVHDMTDVLSSRYYNEIALNSLSHLDYEEAYKIAQAWHVVRTDYKTRILRTTVIDETGHEFEAINELESIRKDIQLQKLSDNYTLSEYLESCLQQTDWLLAIYDFRHHINGEKEPYKQNVISFQRIIASLKDEQKKQVTNTHGFALNTHDTSWNFQSSDFVHDYLYSYRLLAWMEESGYPFGHYLVNTESEGMALAIGKIIRYEPEYAICSLVRSCNRKVLKNTLTREAIQKIDRSVIDKSYNIYYKFASNLEKDDNKVRGTRGRFCIQLLARLAIKASEENVQALFDTMLDNIDRIGYDFERADFYVAYRCLTPPCLNKLVSKLYMIPYFGSNSLKIEMPSLYEGNFYISKELLDFLKDGLGKEEPRISCQAYRRIICVYDCLSEDEKMDLKEHIIKWRNNDPRNYDKLDSYHFFPYEDGEKINIVSVVNKEIDDIDVTKYKVEDKSSKLLSDFDSVITSILPVINLADYSHKEQLLQKIYQYLLGNVLILKTDDSEDVFGGLRHYSNILIYNICGTIQNGGIDTYSKDTIENLFKIFKLYAEVGFHVLYMLSQLSRRIGKVSEIEGTVISRLFTGNIEGTMDVLSALAQILAETFDEELITKVESYIEFGVSEDVPTYIIFLNQLIKDGLYPLAEGDSDFSKTNGSQHRNKQLEALLLKLAHKVNTSDDTTTMADIENETIYLVHALVEKHPYWTDNKAVIAWREINDSEKTFNDVRWRGKVD